jgi:hypothetical protein
VQITPLPGRYRPRSIFREQHYRQGKFEANYLGRLAMAVPICDCVCDLTAQLLDMAATGLKRGARN